MEYATLKGKKLNMSQIFLPTGKVVPVTVVELESAEALANADNFMDKKVVITGKSKGKGFTGAIKRWGFRKQGETRGAKDKVRGPGAIGAQTPGRVFKGKKMAGRKGNVQITVKGLRIVNIDKDAGYLMVSGPIPGARNSQVTLKIEGVSLNEPVEEKVAEQEVVVVENAAGEVNNTAENVNEDTEQVSKDTEDNNESEDQVSEKEVENSEEVSEESK